MHGKTGDWRPFPIPRIEGASRSTVLTSGSTTERTGKFNDCEIQDGRNWRCKANAEFPRTITREMVRGCPVKDTTGQARSFRQVSKLRWFLLKYGMPTGNAVASGVNDRQ